MYRDPSDWAVPTWFVLMLIGGIIFWTVVICFIASKLLPDKEHAECLVEIALYCWTQNLSRYLT